MFPTNNCNKQLTNKKIKPLAQMLDPSPALPLLRGREQEILLPPLPSKGARLCFQTLYVPVCCQEDPPPMNKNLSPYSSPLKGENSLGWGENPVKVPLFKGDLGGSPRLQTRPRGVNSTFTRSLYKHIIKQP